MRNNSKELKRCINAMKLVLRCIDAGTSLNRSHLPIRRIERLIKNYEKAEKE